MKKLVIAAAAAVGLAAVAPAVAQAPAVNISISKPGGGPIGTTTTVLFGQLVRVSGNISSGQANQPITLVVSPYRGPARNVSLTSNSVGEFSYVDRPRVRTSYAARWNNVASGQEPYAHVRPKVGLRVISARQGVFRVTMSADPRHVSRVVYMERRIGTEWHTIKRVRLQAGNLSARFTARLPRGSHRVRMVSPRTPGYLRGVSRFVLVRR